MLESLKELGYLRTHPDSPVMWNWKLWFMQRLSDFLCLSRSLSVCSSFSLSLSPACPRTWLAAKMEMNTRTLMKSCEIRPFFQSLSYNSLVGYRSTPCSPRVLFIVLIVCCFVSAGSLCLCIFSLSLSPPWCSCMSVCVCVHTRTHSRGTAIWSIEMNGLSVSPLYSWHYQIAAAFLSLLALLSLLLLTLLPIGLPLHYCTLICCLQLERRMTGILSCSREEQQR